MLLCGRIRLTNVLNFVRLIVLGEGYQSLLSCAIVVKEVTNLVSYGKCIAILLICMCNRAD